jgi:hypothetical protein
MLQVLDACSLLLKKVSRFVTANAVVNLPTSTLDGHDATVQSRLGQTEGLDPNHRRAGAGISLTPLRYLPNITVVEVMQ